MSNGTSKAKILENCGISALYQETVGEWLINIVSKQYYAVNNPYPQ